MSNILGTATIDDVAPNGDHTERPAVMSSIGINYIPTGENSTLRGMLDEAETQVIVCALQHTRWNRKRAAALLKISYRGLLYKIRRHRITPPANDK